MDELIKKENGKYKKYEELLLKRDQLNKEAGAIHTLYIKEFGELLLEDFELKIECIKKKKQISYCQAAINRGETINVQEMNNAIDQSMALYNLQLKEMIANKNAADKSKTSPSYKVERAKRIYRRLAKTVHPDIYPLTNDNEELRDLWDRIVIAYNCNDDEELDNLEILVSKILKENGDVVGNVEIDDINERIKKLEYEINEIITTEPYTYMEILFTEDKVNEKKEILKNEIEEYKKYSSELSEMIQKILSEGGATLTWISF